MAKVTNNIGKKLTTNVNRTGIHAKSKTSALKASKNYKKLYKGQG